MPIGREGSLFQRIFSSLSGIDPYASAVSDVYQDLFGEGSYAGKGIYDIDAFEAAQAGRAPESTLLSHDLFEGVFARAGLASDVEVVEEFPARYDVGALRHHRWARGDWQLLPWILGRPPKGSGPCARQRGLPAVGRWKMLDNLRRTLSPPVAVLALLLGWSLPLPAASIWTLFVVLTVTLPTLIPVVAAIPPRRPGVTRASHVRALGGDLRLALIFSTLTLTFLADQACLMTDAIGRTLWRLGVSRRHLLEWAPAAQATCGTASRHAGLCAPNGRRGRGRSRGFGGRRGVWRGILAAGAAFRGSLDRLAGRRPPDQPVVERRSHIRVDTADAVALRATARRTWRFFETFVTPLDNMLPPDNFQEDPKPEIAHRTSPTNIGLYLLSVVSARDFGWIGTDQAIGRLEATLASMSRLQRMRGHFYNWYDTALARPLNPMYVSTVDSGNLAGHLIALANACREWRERPLADERRLDGIADALEITGVETARLRGVGGQTQTVTLKQIDRRQRDGRPGVATGAFAREDLSARLARLAGETETMIDIAGALAIERGDGSAADMLFWARATLRRIDAHNADLARTPTLRFAQARLETLETTARSMALAMDFGFLLDPSRQLLSIGFLRRKARSTQLLRSSGFGSAPRQLLRDRQRRHFRQTLVPPRPLRYARRPRRRPDLLGRLDVRISDALARHARAGGSLLDAEQSSDRATAYDYAAKLGLPWGISESAYNARDLAFTYQYSNFGVPGLGLKRGIGEDQVVAPYATALAAMVDPRAATANLARLTEFGALGRFGFYDAVDFTASAVA